MFTNFKSAVLEIYIYVVSQQFDTSIYFQQNVSINFHFLQLSNLNLQEDKFSGNTPGKVSRTHGCTILVLQLYFSSFFC